MTNISTTNNTLGTVRELSAIETDQISGGKGNLCPCCTRVQNPGSSALYWVLVDQCGGTPDNWV
jgi:hypothetical protein